MADKAGQIPPTLITFPLNITKEEIEKAMETFYWGDIGNTRMGFKLMRKDEETINRIGKVLFNLAKKHDNNKQEKTK